MTMFFRRRFSFSTFRLIPIFLLSVVVLFSIFKVVLAQDCGSDFDCQYSQIQREIDALTPAQENNKKELANLNKQILDIKAKINTILSQLSSLEKQISVREEELAYATEIFNQKTNNHYRFLRTYDPITPFLTENAVEAFRESAFLQRAADGDRETIDKYAQELSDLKKDRDNLEKNKAAFASLQKQISEKADFLSKEVAKVDQYLTTLSNKQQEILNAKNGSFIASVGDSELADDYYASIKGFREAAPSGSFAVFSFGAYTHRKGMSQYGARGRAQTQSYTQILKAYYGKEPVTKDTGGNINVDGVGSVNFEDYYLMGIAEMPSSWHPNALKAQAVAARTYAYRFKLNGTTICTTESCQVFRKSKADSPPSEWRQAVLDTRGQVLEDVVTYYSSTTGGFTTTSGWDTTDGSGGSSFFDKSYEKIGGSPWAYKAWYRQGYSSSGATCGRSSPWLTNAEFADIVNAAIALKDNKGDTSRITPLTTSCWGGNPYSMDELRAVGGVNSVTSVTVSQGNGYTNNVIVNGISFTGDQFKQAFNLRAPGYLSIPQKGFAFFNVERK